MPPPEEEPEERPTFQGEFNVTRLSTNSHKSGHKTANNLLGNPEDFIIPQPPPQQQIEEEEESFEETTQVLAE